MDSLSEFCAGLTWADVERERLAPLARARREFFSGRSHRDMLAVHELNVQKAHLAGIIRGDLDGPSKLNLADAESAEFERQRVLEQKRAAESRRRARLKRKESRADSRVEYTRAQIDIAIAAMDKQEAGKA